MMRIEDIPVLGFWETSIALLESGEPHMIDFDQACDYVRGKAPFLFCRPLGRLSAITAQTHYDLMELWAFLHPTTTCPPLILNLSIHCDYAAPQNAFDAALRSRDIACHLVEEARLLVKNNHHARAIAEMMKQAGWLWGDLILADDDGLSAKEDIGFLLSDIIKTLPKWKSRDLGESEDLSKAGENADKSQLKEEKEDKEDFEKAQSLLQKSLGARSEIREGQKKYMRAVFDLFSACHHKISSLPLILLAQAQTGIGKTIAYLVPAFLTARAQEKRIWCATYSRALQNQIARESHQLDFAKVAIRKGRDNYLCLLLFEEALRHLAGDKILLGFVARWLHFSQDGDIRSGDFPSWLIKDRRQATQVSALTDRHSICIHAACPHYSHCFIERQRVEAQDADITIANHALILSQSASGTEEVLPSFYIFDEGHHLFSAADSAFSFRLSARRMALMRHWLIGEESGNSFGDQGLARRIHNLSSRHKQLSPLIEDFQNAADFLPQRGFLARLRSNAPIGQAEVFLTQICQKVTNAQKEANDLHSLESQIEPIDSHSQFHLELERLYEAGKALRVEMEAISESRQSASLHRLKRWVDYELSAWVFMSKHIENGQSLAQWVDRFVIERDDGVFLDCGMFRHALDPMRAFARNILSPSAAVVITSASLTSSPTSSPTQSNQGGQMALDWQSAEWLTGARHLPYQPRTIYAESPFDYAHATRCFVITDSQWNSEEKARAMAELFCASQGGGLGLWTAKHRLRQAQPIIQKRLQKEGLLLLTQHVDMMALSDLIDVFRQDEKSCLLGTDGLRDGIDVPGEALKLVVFDRMPWARPDILHRARRALFKPRFYDYMLLSLRLQQAFGRLIRKQDDRGVFVMLDSHFPSKLGDIFPKGVVVERVSFLESLERVKTFFA